MTANPNISLLVTAARALGVDAGLADESWCVVSVLAAVKARCLVSTIPSDSQEIVLRAFETAYNDNL